MGFQLNNCYFPCYCFSHKRIYDKEVVQVLPHSCAILKGRSCITAPSSAVYLCTTLSPFPSFSSKCSFLLFPVIRWNDCFPSKTNKKVSLSVCFCHLRVLSYFFMIFKVVPTVKQRAKYRLLACFCHGTSFLMHLHIVTVILVFTHGYYPFYTFLNKLAHFFIQACRKEQGGGLVQTVVRKRENIVTYGKQVLILFKLLMVQSCCICQMYQKIQSEKEKKRSFLVDLVEGRCSKHGMYHHICCSSAISDNQNLNVGRHLPPLCLQ